MASAGHVQVIGEDGSCYDDTCDNDFLVAGQCDPAVAALVGPVSHSADDHTPDVKAPAPARFPARNLAVCSKYGFAFFIDAKGAC